MISKIGGGLLFYFGSALFLETFGHDQAVFFAINGGFLEAFIILSILCPLLFFAAKKPAQQKLYPEYKTKEWTIKDSLFSAFCWFIFLSGYEYLFRGLLFYSLIPSFGFWNAVSISTALYVLAHLHKEASETFSCIFMGIIFCIIAWKSGGILIPSILHSLIVIITENFCELHRKNAKASS